jgi:hypothetical protein
MTSSNRSASVDQFMQDLLHPMRSGVEAIRNGILDSNPMITEQIKWKAPNFCYAGNDRVTFNLRAPDRLKLIFHRGAKVVDSSNFAFEDPTGLMKWVSADRAIVTFDNIDSVERRLPELVSLVNRWMVETT